VFFLSRMRGRLASGDARLDAARRTTAEFLPIIFTAGLIVAAGSAALVVARLGFLRVFGPGLAITVVVGLVVSITLMPALLGIFGGALFWPRRPRAVERATGIEADQPGRRWRERLVHFATARPVALLVAVVAMGALIVPGLFVKDTRLGFRLADALPHDAEEFRAEAAAKEGFAAGILSPTLVLVRRPGLDGQTQALAALEDGLRRQPGVAGVVGPRLQEALSSVAQQTGVESGERLASGVFVSKDGGAARYLLVLEHDPLGAEAVDDLEAIRARMPRLLQQTGLGGAEVEYAGNTALVQETIGLTLRDLGRISIAALLVDLVLLVMFLRALVAPLFLLAASVLALAAALGLTTFVFQDVLHHSDLTYYVPIAAAVLLVSLGSDYNVFVVGRIWEEARRRPLREAIAVGAPGAARAIAVAALALAGSFALLVLVPLTQFREFAFAMVAGILIDSFLVRSILVPALISLFGTTSGWPGRRLRLATPEPSG
jgi:putative drug exporter of the RND superfamily